MSCAVKKCAYMSRRTPRGARGRARGSARSRVTPLKVVCTTCAPREGARDDARALEVQHCHADYRMPVALFAVGLSAVLSSGPQPPLSPPAGQGRAAHQLQPGFNWQPPASAPLPDPLFAGNGTALWLRAAGAPCDSWYPPIEEFLLLRIMQNRFLSTALPSCGYAVGTGGFLTIPSGAEVTTLRRMFTQMDSLAVAVAPVVLADSKTLRDTMHSKASIRRLAASLAAERALRGYDGFVLSPDVSTFNRADGTAFAAMVRSIAEALGPRASFGVEIDSASQAYVVDPLAEVDGVIVYITNATTARNFDSFAAAVSDATHRFRSVSIGLSLDGATWWGGTKRPSIVDVQTRLAHMAGNNVSQVSLAVNWRDLDFIADQSRLDLFQLTLLTPFRGVAGMQWQTLAGPEDGSVAKRAAWGKGVDEWHAWLSELGWGWTSQDFHTTTRG